jgi:hypothetical protein
MKCFSLAMVFPHQSRSQLHLDIEFHSLSLEDYAYGLDELLIHVLVSIRYYMAHEFSRA